MLARSFLSATDLGISDVERDALIKVLGMLERGELVHRGTDLVAGHNGFNMGWAGSRTDCGTLACIGGWVAILRKGHPDPTYVYGSVNGPLHGLYWPRHLRGLRLSEITAEHAAHALSNFLTAGKPRWHEVLAT